MKKKKVLFMLQMQKYLNYAGSEFEIMKMLSGFPFVSRTDGSDSMWCFFYGEVGKRTKNRIKR